LAQVIDELAKLAGVEAKVKDGAMTSIRVFMGYKGILYILYIYV
jgi:hypothetical protein